MKFEDLEQKVQNVINQFIEPIQQDPNVLGILLVGSYSHSKPQKNSDLDIYIILENHHERERGNLYIDGFEIEYFFNPMRQVEEYIKAEDILRPNTLHMLANGILLYERAESSEVTDLINFSQRKIAEPLPALTEDEVELNKYLLDDLIKDLDDARFSGNTVDYYFVSGAITQACVKIALRVKQVYQEKYKRLAGQLMELDQRFHDLLLKCVNEKDDFGNLQNLVKYCETLLGGPRSKEWSLRGGLTYHSKK